MSCVDVCIRWKFCVYLRHVPYETYMCWRTVWNSQANRRVFATEVG